LSQQIKRAWFLFGNPSNPSNIWACLRNLDSFQIQHVDAIADLEAYTGKVVASQRHGMMTVIIGDFTGNLNT
jgi:hypothetical protein